MATLDPDVGECLQALLETPLASLARIAIDLIVADSQELEDGDLPFHDGWWKRRERREDQLEIAHRIISGRIKREIAMLQRLRVLSQPLRVQRLQILPSRDALAAKYDDENLLDPRREAALLAFLNTWMSMRDGLSEAWETPDAR